MRIGIDIDDVITNSSELIIKYAKKFFRSDSIDLVNNILHVQRKDSELLDFYYKYLPEMMENYTLKENFKDVINRFREKNHEIIVITARGYSIQNGIIEVTNDYFKNHNIFVDKVIFKAKDKRSVCLRENIDIMIDDSIEVLESLRGTDVKCILFTSISNKAYQVNLERVSNWLELEQKIYEYLKDQKPNNVFKYR